MYLKKLYNKIMHNLFPDKYFDKKTSRPIKCKFCGNEKLVGAPAEKRFFIEEDYWSLRCINGCKPTGTFDSGVWTTDVQDLWINAWKREIEDFNKRK